MTKTRKVPLNYRNVTGMNGSAKSDYSAAESTLEADFLTLLDFNKDVARFRTQPVTIEYQNNGIPCTYTPDVKVELKSGKVIIYEVKYRKDLFENWPVLKPKFRAAIQYAKKIAAEFKIVTEIEIRTNYLQNIKFLKTYYYAYNINYEKCMQVENMIAELRCTTPKNLLAALQQFKWNRAECLFAIWLVIAAGEHGLNRVRADLYKPLSMNTEIWCNNE